MGQYAADRHGQVNGETIRKANALLLQRFGKPVTACSVEELKTQIGWLEKTLGLGVKEREVIESTPEINDNGTEFVQAGLFA